MTPPSGPDTDFTVAGRHQSNSCQGLLREILPHIHLTTIHGGIPRLVCHIIHETTCALYIGSPRRHLPRQSQLNPRREPHPLRVFLSPPVDLCLGIPPCLERPLIIHPPLQRFRVPPPLPDPTGAHIHHPPLQPNTRPKDLHLRTMANHIAAKSPKCSLSKANHLVR